MAIIQKYIPAHSNNIKMNNLEVRLEYDLGGMNYFTYRETQRGYYLIVSPVTKERNMVSFEAFSGIKKLLVECKRASKSAEAKARAMVEEVEKDLIAYLDNKYGIVLD